MFRYSVKLLILILTSINFAQVSIYRYENLLNLDNTYQCAALDNTLYCVSEVGVYSYNFNDGTYKIYTKSNGLSSQYPTAIAIDKSDRIWIGHLNGMIDILRTDRKNFDKIFDIKNSQKNSKRINFIAFSNDTAIIASDFGVSLIDANKLIFFDTAVKFSYLEADLPAFRAIKYKERIIVGLKKGLAISRLGSINLTSPDSWEVKNVFSGLPSNEITAITFLNDTLFVGTNKGIAKSYDFSTFFSALSDLNEKRILDLITYKNVIYILAKKDGEPYSIYSYNGQEFKILKQAQRGAFNSILMHRDRMHIASNYGLIRLDQNFNQEEVAAINGPASNLFAEICVDKQGNLWGASGNNDMTSRGFYKYDGLNWQNFNVQNTPILGTNNYYKVATGGSGSVYLSSWGAGLLIYVNGEFKKIDNSTHPELIGNSQTYIVIGGVGEDSQGNIWFLNAHSLTRKSLGKLDKSGNLTLYENPFSTQAYLNAIHLLIDQYDTKWITTKRTTVNSTDGLFFFNEKRNIVGANPLGWGKVNLDSEGSTSRSVNAIALDKKGDLWVGRSLGANIISNLLSPNSRISSVFSLRQYTINCIAVDALNQKWIGSNSGLFVVSTDGSNLIAHFTTENSPLLNDNIISISIDEQKGIAYVASDNGLTALFTPYVKGQSDYKNISVHPNPFILSESNENVLVITGLQSDSKIKIYDLAGNQIRELKTIGGGVDFWDGASDNGKLVSTGIYLIVATNANSTQSGIAKVAVIRK